MGTEKNQQGNFEDVSGCAVHKMNNSLAVIKVKTYLMLKSMHSGSLRAAELEKHLEDISLMADRVAELLKELRNGASNSDNSDEARTI